MNILEVSIEVYSTSTSPWRECVVGCCVPTKENTVGEKKTGFSAAHLFFNSSFCCLSDLMINSISTMRHCDVRSVRARENSISRFLSRESRWWWSVLACYFFWFEFSVVNVKSIECYTNSVKAPISNLHKYSSTCSQIKSRRMTPQIQKPAPDFKSTAVVNGQFKEIQLSDYKGKYLVR